jgi:histidyl-tRNA synthetase
VSYRAPKGTHDTLPGEVRAWQRLEAVVRSVMDRFGYEEIRTPLFEETSLFARSVGETTDIVKKEMYTFTDRRGRNLTLRPEGTAPVARAFIEHHLGRGGRLAKLFYMGPMFRYERPQAGRFRQFHQFGAEAIGSGDPTVDVDVIVLFARVLEEAGLSGLEVALNSVGDAACRPRHVAAIREALAPHRDALCPDCQERLERNPLRILDCKVPSCRALASRVPTAIDFLCEPCRAHHRAVEAGLAELGVAHRIDPNLVRGIDYYTRTAFEIHHGALGAQNALGGGGRYDGLIAELGGSATPGIGFAAGMERILTALGETVAAPRASVAVIALGAAEEAAARRFLYRLRRVAPAELVAGDAGLGKKLRAANDLGARYAVIFGEEETRLGRPLLKDMTSGDQSPLSEGEIVQTMKRAAAESAASATRAGARGTEGS